MVVFAPQGMDMPGNDMANYALNGMPNPLSVCEQLCCNTSGCVGVVLANPQPELAGNQLAFNCKSGDACCWLKSQVR